MITRFELITKANGYNSDLGIHIVRWNTETISDDPIDSMYPAMNLKDGGADIWIETIGLWNHEVSVDLEIFTIKGKSTATEMMLILEDVFRAVGTDDTWGGLAEYTLFDREGGKRSVDLSVEQYKKTIARAILSMKVLYRTEYWKI